MSKRRRVGMKKWTSGQAILAPLRRRVEGVVEMAGVGAVDAPHPQQASSSKHKAYASAVEKALKAFDNTSEWADLISALQKLSKVLQSNAKFGYIPNAMTVAKRLSQCLHPNLTAGVHSKALEIYRQIFEILNPDLTSKHLYLFAVGLFPLMDNCGIKVKAELLKFFDDHLLPLGARLRPALPGFLAGLLLGLEEGSEHYEETFRLLEKVREAVGACAFYACLWQAVLGSPSVRLPALLYVNAKFDKSKPMEDQMDIVGDSVNHMVSALCAAGEDVGSALVQRNLLDLLSAAFALDTTILKRDDFVQLLRRCLFVVLRRDMSLNRRLYQWILNPTGVTVSVPSVPVGDDAVDTSFFVKTSLPLIVLALRQFLLLDTIEIPHAPAGVAYIATAHAGKEVDQQQFVEVRVCRLLSYLQDRPEVGRPVLDRVLPLLLLHCSRLLPPNEDSSAALEMIGEDYGSTENREDSNGGGFSRESRESSGTIDPVAMRARLSLNLRKESGNLGLVPNLAAITVPAGGTVDMQDKEEKEKIMARRRDEVSKNLNALMKSVDDDGFLWGFLGEWFDRLLSSVDDEVHRNEGEEEADEEARENSTRELAAFPKVLAYCLSVVQLNATSAIRARHLPRLLRRILARTASLHLTDDHRNFLILNSISMSSRLLSEIAQSSGTLQVEHKERVETPASPFKNFGGLIDEKEQALVESCMHECVRLLSSICRFYSSQRSTCRWPLLRAICGLLLNFADFPLYCAGALAYTQRQPLPLPGWVADMLKVMDIGSWLRDLSSGRQGDFEPRATCLEVLVRLSIRSASVIAQHTALEDRRPSGTRGTGAGSTTVLLKPILFEGHLVTLEEQGIFDLAGQAVWAGAGSSSPEHHQHAASLVALLHARKPAEPSSAVEQAVVTALTSTDSVVSTDAARTFHSIWTLTRHSDDLGPGIRAKPFNRVVMLLLGVLADDSVSFEKVELKSVATAWFVDCARHNDLPTIIQMLAMMLMNPATARVSIQYVKMESRITREQQSSLPENMQSVTLVTADQRQRLHHLIEDAEQAAPAGAWLTELRGRLLLQTSAPRPEGEEGAGGTGLKVAGGGAAAIPDPRASSPIRPGSDVLNFDDDSDSLDTFSLEGIEAAAVLETLQYLIDTVCDEEESELDAQRRFATANIDGVAASTSLDSVGTAQGMNAEELQRVAQARAAASREAVTSSSLAAQPGSPTAPPTGIGSAHPSNLSSAHPAGLSESISRMRRGHRRADSLAETIFSMNNDLRLFDTAETRPSTTASTAHATEAGGGDPGGKDTVTSANSSASSTAGAAQSSSSFVSALYEESHAHMLLYGESGRVVDLGRSETGFRILTALLRPRGAPIPASILLNCLVSSVTSSSSSQQPPVLSTSSDGSSGCSLQDLMARHVRAILGQQFWSREVGGGEREGDDSRSKNLTLLELIITISLHFLRSYFLNSPIAPVTFGDLVMSWKCKIAVIELLTELLRELGSMITAEQSRTFVWFVHSLLTRAKMQRCLLLLLVSSVKDLRSADEKDPPLSILIAEFNEGRQRGAGGARRGGSQSDSGSSPAGVPGGGQQRRGASARLAGLVAAYNRALLSLTATTIRLEYEIKMGFFIYKDQATLVRQLTGPQLFSGHQPLLLPMIGGTMGRVNTRELPPPVVELRMFLQTLQTALRQFPECHEAWLQLIVHILPYLDRALPTFSGHVMEQLCKNIETSIMAAYQQPQALVGSPAHFATGSAHLATGSAHLATGSAHLATGSAQQTATSSPETDFASGRLLGADFPANFVVMSFETLTTLLHFCVVDANAAPPTTSPLLTAGGSASSASSLPGGAAPAANHSTTALLTSGGGPSSMVGQALAIVPGTRGATELFTNLVKVFSFGDSSSNVPVKLEQRTTDSSWREARAELLKRLPQALATICDVWSVVSNEQSKPLKPVGTPAQLRRQVLELLSPVAQHHQQQFLESLAGVWQSRGDVARGVVGEMDKSCFDYSPAQLDMTGLLLSLKVIPFDALVSAVSEMLKEAGAKNAKATAAFQDKAAASAFPTESPLLEMLHGCVRRLPQSQLAASWPALHCLLVDAPLAHLPSRAVFLLFIILCDYVRLCAPCSTPGDERQKPIGRQLQQVTVSLVESINAVVGWQLEQTTWLKRTLVVKDQAGGAASAALRSTDNTPSLEGTPLQTSLSASDASHRTSTLSLAPFKSSSTSASTGSGAGNSNSTGAGNSNSSSGAAPSAETTSLQLASMRSNSSLRASVKDTNNNKRDPAESTRALFLLADNLAELVDCVCRSEEKEKLLPTLHAVWANVVPYLKAKNARNARFFLASSQLLATMSSYSYMRPVWRKTTIDLLSDPAFFKMDQHSLKQWLIVCDHLMTQDKNSFREVLKLVAYVPNTSFSIMTSKEQEYETRSQSLKRLAFVILGSELDQYRAQLPDIQERLAENLRLCQQVPSIRAAVLLCYRVLLLRLQPTSLISMWPIMVTELVHVLLQVEQTLETGSADDLTASRDDAWMQLYLAAGKLLESLCTLPAGYLAHFQMCHWAFVSTVSANKSDVFVPFAGRISKLLTEKFGALSDSELSSSSASLCHMKHLTSFDELRPFFHALATANSASNQTPSLRDAVLLTGCLSHRAAVQRLEHALYVDFAEHWQL